MSVPKTTIVSRFVTHAYFCGEKDYVAVVICVPYHFRVIDLLTLQSYGSHYRALLSYNRLLLREVGCIGAKIMLMQIVTGVKTLRRSPCIHVALHIASGERLLCNDDGRAEFEIPKSRREQERKLVVAESPISSPRLVSRQLSTSAVYDR